MDRIESRIDELEARLTQAESRAAAAERAARRTRVAAGLVALAAGVLLGVRPGQGQPRPPRPAPPVAAGKPSRPGAPKPMKVSKMTAPFQVVDTSGRLLLQVQNGRPGPELILYGSAGTPLALLGTAQDGGGRLDVYDRTGKVSFTK